MPIFLSQVGLHNSAQDALEPLAELWGLVQCGYLTGLVEGLLVIHSASRPRIGIQIPS